MAEDNADIVAVLCEARKDYETLLANKDKIPGWVWPLLSAFGWNSHTYASRMADKLDRVNAVLHRYGWSGRAGG